MPKMRKNIFISLSSALKKRKKKKEKNETKQVGLCLEIVRAFTSCHILVETRLASPRKDPGL